MSSNIFFKEYETPYHTIPFDKIKTSDYKPAFLEGFKQHLEEIAKNLKPLGKNLVGSIFQNGYTSTGTTELWWEALHLPENDFINSYGVADAGADNGGSYEEDSPLYYSYDSSLDVINNGAAYFPLKVTYQGEKPTEDYDQIRKVSYSKLFHFNAIKKEYK